MNNLSDKNVLIIIFITIIFIFLLIFSVKSPERKVIESPLMWKSDFLESSKTDFSNNIYNKRTLL
tara:strand:- start:245 stop:439 length:195 start_codon:yes stop_codon:yes gene_type:complete